MGREIEKIKLVILRVTNNCNLRCRYCYACGGDNRESMSWDIARKAIDYAAASGSPFKVQFTGGEPLLNLPLIREIVAYTRKKKIAVRYQVQTNGALITPQIAAELKAMGIAPGISLDGMPEVNDRLRPFAGGRGSTAATLQGLSNLGAVGVKAGITAVLTAQSVAGLPRLVELASYMGNVHGIALDLLRPLGRAGVNKILPPEPAIMEDSVRACLRRAEEIARLGGNPVRFREVERLEWQLSRRLTRQHYCYATTGQSFAVMPGGDVYPCSSLAGLPDFYLGNISEQDFSLLAGLARLPFLRRKVSDLDGCRGCPDNWLCGGGCPSAELKAGGTPVTVADTEEVAESITEDLAEGQSYDIYVVAENNNGSLQVTPVKVTVTMAGTASGAYILSTDPTTLSEAEANDGSLDPNAVVVTIADGTLAADIAKADVNTANLPSGLDYTVTRDSDTQLTITITGNAASHTVADDVYNLTFTIAKVKVTGAVSDLTTENISIDFNDPPAVIDFPDPGLEAAVREAIDKPTGDIYQDDLDGLTLLDACSRDISDLSGLEYCTSLTELYLDDNQNSDISLLTGLNNLTDLSLSAKSDGTAVSGPGK